jgi:hypothetical protein
MSLVWKTNLDSTEKLVLLYYADKAHDDGSSIFPSKQRVANGCSLCKRTVQKVTKGLIQAGILRVEGRSKYGTQRYSIDITNLQEVSRETNQPKEGEHESNSEVNFASQIGEPRTPKSLSTINKPVDSFSNFKKRNSTTSYTPVIDEGIKKAFVEKFQKGLGGE